MSGEFTFRLDGRGDCERLLVLLHGFGATQHDIASISSRVDPDGRFFVLCPRGPIDTPGGGASWYDFDDTWRPDPASFATALSGLDRLVESVCSRLHIERSHVVVGGFSQGAGLAAWLAYATPDSSRPAGFWCCGTIVDVDGTPLDLSTAKGTKALVLAGRQDHNVPLERSRTQARNLEHAGAEVNMGEHDGGHGLSNAMLDDMRHWLAAFN
ncbi:MAG: hypothetical protein R2707_07580 [Acidimicrobiales bacterium]